MVLRNAVEKWRRDRRLSMTELARRAGISWLTLKRIEVDDGKYATNQLVMEGLARALNTSKDVLFWAEDSPAGNGTARRRVAERKARAG